MLAASWLGRNAAERRSDRYSLDRIDHAGGNAIGVGIRSGTAILKISLPAVLNGADRDSDRSASVGDAVAKLVDRLRLVQSGQTLIVARAVLADMGVVDRPKRLADRLDHIFAALVADVGIREVGVHSASVPIPLDRLGVQLDAESEPLGGSHQQVTRDPQMIGGFLSFTEQLEFPLSLHHLGVDPGHLESRFQAQIEVFLDQVATDAVIVPHGTVIRALGAGIAIRRKAERLGSLHDRVLLFETEPEIRIVLEF
jgi:hypothetical protein